MTLGDIIKEYRKKNGYSMDTFSERSGISKAYISLLEKNRHPKTGKAIAPSIQCIRQAADGMNMDFNTLFSMIDSNVSLKEASTLFEPTTIAAHLDTSDLTEAELEDVADYIEFIRNKRKK